MLNILRPRKKTIKFENNSEYRRKLVKIYYIVKDDINVYINNIINYDVDNPIPIPTSY